ncbi:MAG: ABC transporter ATP-binding protein [Anaerolineales bacterium]
MNPTTKAASIEFEGISFSYPGADQVAVTDISISVKPTELVVLVGPSGCGKSTLLRIAAGLIQPNKGRLLLDGDDTLNLPTEKRQIGWVPQSYALFDHLDVNGNVAFGLRMQRFGKEEREKRVHEMLDLCRISDFAHRPVADLSGGQRQRVAIARALAMYPRVLLLDEPLAALDPQLRVALRADLEALLRESGVTTLFVTHDQSEALAIADRVAVLRAGRMEQYDTPEELWNHPANAFVAEFVSRANTLQARVLEDNIIEIVPGLRATVNGGNRISGSAVVLALRPSDFVLDSDGVVVRVTAAEYAGGTYIITGKLSTGSVISLMADERVQIGDDVRVSVRPGARLNAVNQ